MKELSDLLREINNDDGDGDSEMEFGEDFAKLQTIFNHTNQFVRSFDKIVFQGGNEPHIIEIVARLVKYLRIRRYLNEENKPIRECEHQLRKITLFMVLNTEANFKYDLSRDNRLCHLLQTVPQLTKCLLLNCVWGASLDEFFYEMIAYSPQWFMMQFVEQAVASLKFAKPFEILERVEELSKAIYYSICRTDVDWKKVDRNRFVEQQRTLGKLFDSLMELLRYFHTPDMAKFERWTRLRMFRYSGFALRHLFGIVMHCFDLYLNRSLFEVDPKMAIYQIMDEKHVPRAEIPEAYSPGTDSHLMKINNCLLNALQTLVMEITVDGFAYWAEVDLVEEGGTAEQQTLQQSIGESAYKLCEILKENKVLHHNVLKQLPTIALRPRSQAERAMDLTMGALMAKLERTKEIYERKMYFNEMIRRGAQVFGNGECLELIEQNLELVSGDNVRKMVEYDNRPKEEEDGEAMDADDDDDDGPSDETIKLRELILKSVDYLLPEEANTLIKFMISAYGLEYDLYRTTTLAEQIVEYTNRFNSMQLDEDEIFIPMVLIFQCPSLFYSRLTRSLYDAGFANANYINAITRVIARTKSLAVPYLSAQVRSLLSGQFEICRSNSLSLLVLKLYELDLFERNHFLQGYLLEGADEAFRTSNLAAFAEIISLTQLVVDKNLNVFKLDTLRQTVLKLARIAESLRYDVTRLQPEHSHGVERVALLEKILKVILGPVRMLRALKDESKKAFKEQTERFAPITRFYFQRTFAEVANGKIVLQDLAKFLLDGTELSESTPKAQVRLFLSKTLVQCTTAEADKLARDPLLLPHFGDAVLIVLVLLTEQEHHYECLKNCLASYLHVVQKHLLPPLVAAGEAGSADRGALVKSLVKLIVKLPDVSRERLLVALSFGLAAIVQQLRGADPTLDISEIEKVLKQDTAATTVTTPVKVAASVDRNGTSEPTEQPVAMVTE